MFAGINAYRVDKIVSVKKLIETLLMEYENATAIGVRPEAWAQTKAVVADYPEVPVQL